MIDVFLPEKVSPFAMTAGSDSQTDTGPRRHPPLQIPASSQPGPRWAVAPVAGPWSPRRVSCEGQMPPTRRCPPQLDEGWRRRGLAGGRLEGGQLPAEVRDGPLQRVLGLRGKGFGSDTEMHR